MGKRQIRIRQQQLLDKKYELEGITGHVILQDHVVHHGRIQDIYPGAVNLAHARLGLLHIPMAAIFEVVYDQETEY